MTEAVTTPGGPSTSKDPAPSTGELQAECPCGFRRSSIVVGLLAGGSVCSLPALCPRCGRLFVANYLAANPSCPQCRNPLYFYTEPGLRQESPPSEGPGTPARGAAGPSAAGPNAPAPSAPDLLRLPLGHAPEQELRLPNVAYLCPSCGRKTMTFRRTGAEGGAR